MVIIQFKEHHDAVVFIEEFNGRPFNSVEVGYIPRLRVSTTDTNLARNMQCCSSKCGEGGSG